MIKIYQLTLIFMLSGVLAQATPNNSITSHTFNADTITKLKLRLDKSRVVLKRIEGNTIKIERESVVTTPHSHITMEVKNGILEIQSTTPKKGGCEVNYHIELPRDVEVEITGGSVNLKGDVSLKRLSLTLGTLEGTIRDPKCDIRANIGGGEIEIIYNTIPPSPIHIHFSMGNGTLTLRLPKEAVVNHHFTAPPLMAFNNFYSAFAKANSKAHFNVSFTTGGGRLNIYKVSNCL